MTEPRRRLLSTAEVATYLGVPRRNVLQLIHTRNLPAHDIGHGARAYWRVRPEELEAWLERKKTEPPRTYR